MYFFVSNVFAVAVVKGSAATPGWGFHIAVGMVFVPRKFVVNNEPKTDVSANDVKLEYWPNVRVVPKPSRIEPMSADEPDVIALGSFVVKPNRCLVVSMYAATA